MNLHHILLIFVKPVFAEGVVGTVESPILQTYGNFDIGVTALMTNILRLVFVVAGVYALFNFIIAGYQYMMAGGDSKALASAWARIWQTLLGLIIIVASFALAALFGYILFGNAGFILNPVIYGPEH